MCKGMVILALFSGYFCGALLGQAEQTVELDAPSAQAPLYRVSFERQEPIAGINATGVIRMPFQCTSDGTFFVNFIGTVPAGAGVQPPMFPPMLLTSVSASGEGHTFRLDQVPELYNTFEKYHFASDSGVLFLVRASRENKPESPKHLYIISLARNGEYRRTTEMKEAFSVLQVGVFPSGTFLAFGYDEKDHSPKLAMLSADGELLKSLAIPSDDIPKSLMSAADTPHPHAIVPTELVPSEHSILIVQNNTTFPLLEVNEGGAIRAIRVDLPQGLQIRNVIPSDHSMYVIGGPQGPRPTSAGTIFEINPGDGAVLRRIELKDGRDSSDVACVHDGRFLSLDYGDGRVVPLVGTAEPAITVGSRERAK